MVVPRPPKSYVRVQFLPLLTQYILARFKIKKILKRNWFMGRTPFLHNGERSSSLLFLNKKNPLSQFLKKKKRKMKKGNL